MQLTSRLKKLSHQYSFSRGFSMSLAVADRRDSLLCILVARANHLRKVNHHRLVRLASDKNVELVEIAMDQPRVREVHDERHELRIELAWVGHALDGSPGIVSLANGDPAALDTGLRASQWV